MFLIGLQGAAAARFACTYVRPGYEITRSLDTFSGAISEVDAVCDPASVPYFTPCQNCTGAANFLNEAFGMSWASPCGRLYTDIDISLEIVNGEYREYGALCRSDSDVLNEVLGTSFQCERNTLANCRPEWAGRLSQFIDLNGCNGNNGEFVPSGSAGSCTCSAGFAGASCEFSDDATCNGFGNATADGSCVCQASATDCTGRGTYSVDSPDCACACQPTFEGADCAQDPVETKGDEEQESYTAFYIASSVLVGLIVCFGLFCWLDKLGVGETILVLIVGVRSFDMFSDWAFFAISLRKGGAFALAYAAQGGDPDVIWAVSLSFCIAGSLLWLPDLGGFMNRVNPDATDEVRNEAAGVTACVFFFEDLPQLVLNAAIYLPTMGIENADTIAIFALCMSGLSLVLNCMLFWGAVCCKGDASTV